jgi:hypothetical protein
VQTLSAYLLQTREANAERVLQRNAAVDAILSTWLKKKGVQDPSAGEGSFNSLTAGNSGRFR